MIFNFEGGPVNGMQRELPAGTVVALIGVDAFHSSALLASQAQPSDFENERYQAGRRGVVKLFKYAVSERAPTLLQLVEVGEPQKEEPKVEPTGTAGGAGAGDSPISCC